MAKLTAALLVAALLCCSAIGAAATSEDDQKVGCTLTLTPLELISSLA